MIGADNPILHIYTEIRIENKNELVALKTNLGWVIFGGRRNTNKYSDINAFSNKFDLGNIVSKFCRIEWYGVSEKQNPNILPRTEQSALNILWDDDNVKLPDFQNLALSR